MQHLDEVFGREVARRADVPEATLREAARLFAHDCHSGPAAGSTGADMAADGVGTIPFMWTMSNADGTPMAQPPRWGLARERVRHVGEAIAVVIAETVAEAQEAADTIVVDYVPLDAATGSKAALVDGAPQLHSEAPGNRIYSWGRGDTDAADKAIAEAPHSVSLELVNNRIACAAIETRACLAVPDPAGGQTTLYDATQAPHLIRKSITDALCVWDAIQKAKAL